MNNEIKKHLQEALDLVMLEFKHLCGLAESGKATEAEIANISKLALDMEKIRSIINSLD